jgi:hypothetical protein
MPKKYKGRERRKAYYLGDRRSVDEHVTYNQLGRTRHVPPEVSSIMSNAEEHAEIISIKSDHANTDRRHGAGRRKRDFSSALKTGRPVVFDVSKMKNIGKLAEKVIRKKLKLGP